MPRRLGIVGTMVWDRICARDGRAHPVEEWGGIAYALAALAAARPPEWELVPILKVGRDLAERAGAFLSSLPGLDLGPGVREVPEPNNRVELRYTDRERRFERLTGGVPPWAWEELRPLLDGFDALYINFISGFEMELATAIRVRMAFSGPIYCDLHSLMLGVGPDGQRIPRPLADWPEWLRCFDIVQLNEDELGTLSGAWGDPWRFAAEVVGPDLKLLLVTLGERGAAYFASPAFTESPLSWRRDGLGLRRPLAAPGPVRSERLVPPQVAIDGDPTGCGDVWGGTAFIRLLAGDRLRDAVEAANAAAARNARHRGATGLHLYLQGRIGT
ncbi:MAG TPA: carbohydrate kinase family protein [Longimicrobiales bacterium]|nr:carbohydrate kinase family protein [Longimicrobiales bacterium]